MPGETVEDIDREFIEWLNALVALPGSPFALAPEVVFFSRWLPGSAISADQPLVTELAGVRNPHYGRSAPGYRPRISL